MQAEDKRQAGTMLHGQTHRRAYRQAERQKATPTDGRAGGQEDKRTHSQLVGQTDRHSERQAESKRSTKTRHKDTERKSDGQKEK